MTGHASTGASNPIRWPAILGPLALVAWALLQPPGVAAGDAAAGADLPLAVPVSGEPFRARLTAVDAQWLLALDARADRREVPAAGLVSWGAWRETGDRPLIVLADGGLLVADVSAVTQGNLICRSGTFGELTLPLDRVAGAILRAPADRLGRDLSIDRLASASGQSDRVLLANEDELKGSILSLQDGQVRVRTSAGRVEIIEIRRVAAVIFNPALTRREPAPDGENRPRAWAGLSDGSRLLARAMLLDEKSLAITTLGEFTWKASPEGLVAVQPLGGQAAYLSDLRPAAYEHTPYLTLRWPYHRDRNVLGGMLRAGGQLYLKGLGVHSTSRLTYSLTEPYRRFHAELAIDDQTGGRGSVVFRVLVDDQVRYTSPIVRGGQAPLPVSVDVAGAKKLDLVVQFADRADELDHADWLGARLVR